MKPVCGIIGGTGLYNLEFMNNIIEMEARTPYGTIRLFRGELKKTGEYVFFMARHGGQHNIPPHLINYQANIAALKTAGVNCILSTNAVGSLRREMPPGALVILDQFIDFTKNRLATFIDGSNYPVTHLDYTDPYCQKLRKLMIDEASSTGIDTIRKGTYICTEGPRFETPAEIRSYTRLGGDLVGMTNVPEVVLAREAGICYATVALVTNFAAGISPDYLTHEDVLEVMAEHRNKLNTLFKKCIESLYQKEDYSLCYCQEAGKHFQANGQITDLKE